MEAPYKKKIRYAGIKTKEAYIRSYVPPNIHIVHFIIPSENFDKTKKIIKRMSKKERFVKLSAHDRYSINLFDEKNNITLYAHELLDAIYLDKICDNSIL